ncbi:kinesin-like protein KIF26B [Cricetulus griseus]|nr:kinesin-like protein KIF26B [Cricetulus griseus]
MAKEEMAALGLKDPRRGTQTPPLNSAVAAQKLNLSSKKKKHRPSTASAAEAPLFATSFSGILQTSPPPAPPCLLRAVNKVKDTPGMGKYSLEFQDPGDRALRSGTKTVKKILAASSDQALAAKQYKCSRAGG